MKLVLNERNYGGSLWHSTRWPSAVSIVENDELESGYDGGTLPHTTMPELGMQDLAERGFVSFSRVPHSQYHDTLLANSAEADEEDDQITDLVTMEFDPGITKAQRGSVLAPISYFVRGVNHDKAKGREWEAEERLFMAPGKDSVRGVLRFLRSVHILVMDAGVSVDDVVGDLREDPTWSTLGVPVFVYHDLRKFRYCRGGVRV